MAVTGWSVVRPKSGGYWRSVICWPLSHWSTDYSRKREESKTCWSVLKKESIITLLCVSVDGLLGCETSSFIERLADQLSSEWNMSYSTIVCWLRTYLTFFILRATILCLWGSCTKWRTIDMSNGSPLFLIMSWLCIFLLISDLSYFISNLSYFISNLSCNFLLLLFF